jgi:hypothetical protein
MEIDKVKSKKKIEPIVSHSYIKQDKFTSIFQLVVASVLNNNALSFGDKSTTTFKLVVASVKNTDSKGLTKIDLWQCQTVNKNETSKLWHCQLFINKMIVVLFPTFAGAWPPKIMYREEAPIKLIVEYFTVLNVFKLHFQLVFQLAIETNSVKFDEGVSCQVDVNHVNYKGNNPLQ